MVFSSPVFLFLFLPVVLIGYYGVFRKSRCLQNILLTLASLGFYAWGEPSFVFVMLASIIINWFSGLKVEQYKDNHKMQRIIVVLTVTTNVGILFVFKYLSFILNTVTNSKMFNIALPIGISFFTFQAISYVIDISRGNGRARKNPLDVALYISFFPQLIAGPIVRYETIAEQINYRCETLADFSDGIERFVCGFIKKTLIANNIALVADVAFDNGALSILMAWVGAIAYTLQIYYDFSGYSDMAIGLGKIFGFKFNENFDYPYIAKSITEFWRRWHISLGTWFRDYVYFPLGGSRVKTKKRLVLNLFVVWFLTGVWHGANWTFFVWGLMYFVLIVSEKLTGFDIRLGRFGYVYTMLFVVIGWVIFRADSLTNAACYLKTMFGFGVENFSDSTVVQLLYEHRIQLTAGVLFSVPITKAISNRLNRYKFWKLAYQIVLSFLTLFSITAMLSSNYNPFIYFNF